MYVESTSLYPHEIVMVGVATLLVRDVVISCCCATTYYASRIRSYHGIQ